MNSIVYDSTYIDIVTLAKWRCLGTPTPKVKTTFAQIVNKIATAISFIEDPAMSARREIENVPCMSLLFYATFL